MAKFRIPELLVVPFYVLCVVALAFAVGFVAKLFGAYNPIMWGAFTVFGIFGAVAVFAWGRQIYWKITKTGAYQEYPKDEE